MPLYRQEDQAVRYGVQLRRSTLCDWIAAAADLAAPLVQRLYNIESACADQTIEERYAARQQHALPLLTEFGAWLDEQSPRLLPKSPIGAAATYTRNQWAALLRYVEDGELAIDNNVSERTVKMQAIGRKNWLFVASPAGGRRAAALFSLIASCKACGVEPWAYPSSRRTNGAGAK